MWKCGWFSWATACYTFFELCRNIAFIENGCKYMWHTRHTLCLCSCSCSYSGWIECAAGLTGLLTSHPNTCTGMLLCLIHASVYVLCAVCVCSFGRSVVCLLECDFVEFSWISLCVSALSTSTKYKNRLACFNSVSLICFPSAQTPYRIPLENAREREKSLCCENFPLSRACVFQYVCVRTCWQCAIQTIQNVYAWELS